MRMQSLKSHTYATRRLQPGEVFEARPRDARVLRGLQRASDAPLEPGPKPEEEQPIETPQPGEQPQPQGEPPADPKHEDVEQPEEVEGEVRARSRRAAGRTRH